MTTRHVASAVTIMAFALLALGSGKSKDSASGSTKADPAAKAAGSTAAAVTGSVPAAPKTPGPEFVGKREEACTAYKAETNEIKASKVFNDYLTAADAKGYKVADLEGSIDEIKTSTGGGSLILKVKTEIGTFSSNDIFQGNKRDLKKGGAVYKAVTDMNVGDAVVFSGTLVAPLKGFSEKTAVCGDDWVVLFTSIKKK